jgi:hypothetical protein
MVMSKQKLWVLMVLALVFTVACRASGPVVEQGLDSELAKVNRPRPQSANVSDEVMVQYRRIVDEVSAKDSLTLDEISRIYQAAIEHSVARLDELSKYDPDGLIGFCFGRAMTAHLISRKTGLKADRVNKLFVMGDLRSSSYNGAAPEWYFHVTTIVPGPKGVWYAIDPIMHNAGTPYNPLTVPQWMAAVTRGWDATHGRPATAKFYFTPADTVLPDLRHVPNFQSETGDLLIETKYDPTSHNIPFAQVWTKKLKLEASLKNRSFLISPEHMRTHFLHATTGFDTSFDFEKVVIDGSTISWNGYFVDLLKTDLMPAQKRKPASNLTLTSPKDGDEVSRSVGQQGGASNWVGGISGRLFQSGAANQ